MRSPRTLTSSVYLSRVARVTGDRYPTAVQSDSIDDTATRATANGTWIAGGCRPRAAAIAVTIGATVWTPPTTLNVRPRAAGCVAARTMARATSSSYTRVRRFVPGPT